MHYHFREMVLEARERLIKPSVLNPLAVLFIVAALSLLTGCAEESPPPRVLDIEPPRIIAVDPAPALVSDDWLNYHRMSKDHPVLYLPFNGDRNLQIELTFSYPPEDFSANELFRIDGRKVDIYITHCHSSPVVYAYPHFDHLSALYVTWKGGGQRFALWCREEDQAE